MNRAMAAMIAGLLVSVSLGCKRASASDQARIDALESEVDSGRSETRFNVGMVVDFSDTHHLLFSWGRGIPDLSRAQAYVAYQATFGPAEPPRRDDRVSGR